MINEAGGKVVMTQTERDKLAGIATGATNYEHPPSHPITMINEAGGKVVMTQTERDKLAGIATGATNYEHPPSHPITMISEAGGKVVMTQDERDKLAGISENANNIPSGVIVMWSGTAPPAGWALCNGENGTPDLRGRFVIGTDHGSKKRLYPIGSTGGKNYVQLTSDNMPPHYHEYTAIVPDGTKEGSNVNEGVTYINGGGTVTSTVQWIRNRNTAKNDGYGHPWEEGLGSPDYHPVHKGNTANTGYKGKGNPATHLPPYYALAYIIKL